MNARFSSTAPDSGRRLLLASAIEALDKAELECAEWRTSLARAGANVGAFDRHFPKRGICQRDDDAADALVRMRRS